MWGRSIQCDGSSPVDTESGAGIFHERVVTGGRVESETIRAAPIQKECDLARRLSVGPIHRLRTAATRQRGTDDRVHFLQEKADSIVLPVGDGELNRIAQREHLAPLVRSICKAVRAPLSRHISEIGE